MAEASEKIIKNINTNQFPSTEEDDEDIPEIKADFEHWARMSYWTLDEGIALLLDRDPNFVNWDIVQHYQEWPFATEFSEQYAKLRAIFLRASKINEIADSNSPLDFIKWVQTKGIEIPKTLIDSILKLNEVKFNHADTQNLLKLKDEEIITLKKRIEELESLAWEGFDENLPTHSKELAIAVKAHAAISKNWRKGMSIKKQIALWLQQNYPKLMNEERERISKICNWQKSGGAPATL